jgi:hypothetical protein
MELKGKYKLTYTIDRVPTDLVLNVELRQYEGLRILGRNLWEGFATLNGQPYTKEDLTHCVNAKTSAERIGRKLRDEIKENAKKEGKSFRVKMEEVI